MTLTDILALPYFDIYRYPDGRLSLVESTDFEQWTDRIGERIAAQQNGIYLLAWRTHDWIYRNRHDIFDSPSGYQLDVSTAAIFLATLAVELTAQESPCAPS